MRSHRGWPKAFRWNGVMHDVRQIADVWVVEGKSWEPDGGEKSRCFRAFTKYADAGFLITPERYDGEYDALGPDLRVFISRGAAWLRTRVAKC